MEDPAAVGSQAVVVPEPGWLALGLAEAILGWTPFAGDGTDGQAESTERGDGNGNAGPLEELDSGDRWLVELDIGCHDAAVPEPDHQACAVRALGCERTAARARQCDEREQQGEPEVAPATAALHEVASIASAPSRVSRTSNRSGHTPGCHSKRARSKYWTTMPSSTNSSLSG